ncbi:LysE/ArgO family amino acid transporter [Patulibacter minatonensis]|uniref:LysE/ArgO family amino acid transporter n=1 Tax=Patulibacter minatonensis TaxID=298163 RepID=UPI0004B3338A|nr:LysE/ArgO family amino acid transporter [Patulibacter minatonensis]
MLGGPELLAAGAGLLFGLSLIVAIGAQNAFVLRQGLRGEHVLLVVGVCTLSDVLLIVAGVAGTGAVVAGRPGLAEAMRLGGAAFLLAYGALAARRALRPSAMRADEAAVPAGWVATLWTALAFTWLNPHVYLDTVVLLGSVAEHQGDRRWWFAVGAAVASAAWFLALGQGARLLRPVFARRAAWRVLDGAIAVFMVVLAAALVRAAV